MVVATLVVLVPSMAVGLIHREPILLPTLVMAIGTLMLTPEQAMDLLALILLRPCLHDAKKQLRLDG